MTFDGKPFYHAVTDWFAALALGLRSALLSAVESTDSTTEADRAVDSDFEDWLRNDPMVTGNPASRYSDDAPGYLTGNGLGSLEIGAADD